MGNGRGGSGPGTNPRGNPPSPGAPGSPGGGGGGKGGGQGKTSPGGVTNPQGQGGQGEGGGSSNPEPPKVFPQTVRRKAKEDYPEDSKSDEGFLADAQVVNPRFFEKDPEDPGKNSTNCTRCSAAYEMRRQGYEVTAGDRTKDKDDMSLSSIVNKWQNKDGNSPGYTPVKPQREWLLHLEDHEDEINEIQDEDGIAIFIEDLHQNHWETGRINFETRVRNIIRVRTDGNEEGARGFMRVDWDGKDVGHIFNWEIRNGEIQWIESQSQYDGWDKGDGWMDDVDFSSPWNAVIRTDNLTPRKRLFDDGWVYNRRDVEVNAPSYAEFNDELNRRFPPGDTRRAPFRAGWQRARTNQDPAGVSYAAPPGSDDFLVESFKKLQEAYADGLRWTVRPN